MRLGVYLNGYASPGSDAAQVLSDALAQARLAESAGFDWVVLGERHLHRPGHADILTTATYLAAGTETIGIATAGIVLPLYQPYLLAQSLANLDVISAGRLTAGFVLGYRPEEFAACGVPFSRRVRVFEAALERIQALWAGEPVTAAGEDGDPVEVYVAPQPAQQPRPRIWNGCRSPAALRRTAYACDGWAASFNEEPEALARKIVSYRALPAGPRSLGREVIVCRDGFCAATSQRAEDIVRAPLLSLFGEYAQWKKDSPDAARYRDMSWEAFGPRLVVGSPAQVREALQRYDAMGADGVILRLQAPGVAHADVLRCLDLLGEQIIPNLKERS